MVFGYYHINLRTIERGSVPEVDSIPGATISEKVKVGHMLWIPFFPLGKVWVMEHQGNMYTLKPQVARVLHQKYGRSSNPWYSFLGLILVPTLLALFSFSNFMKSRASQARYAERFQKTLASNLDKVNNPNKSDIFIFKDSKYKSVGAKVNYASADSVYFLAPIDNNNKRWTAKNWAAGYFASDNPTQEVAFAKEDLKKTFTHSPTESTYKNKGIPVGKLPLNGQMKLEKIITVSETDKIPVISEAAVEKVKEDFSHFIQHAGNLDSFVNLIDQPSHKYYEDILAMATKSDEEIVKYVKANTKLNNTLYELLLYTKYTYLNTAKIEATKGKPVSLENKKDYLFFLKLLGRGFLTLDGPQIKDVILDRVTIPEKGVATVMLRAQSDMLQRPVKINFPITMRKENGQWKVNLPSAYNYSEKQIRSTFMTGGSNAKTYRGMVRDNVAQVAPDDAYIGNEWVY